MDFAWAVDALRRGLKVTRKGWLLINSTMYMKLVKDTELNRNVARVFCMGLQASTWCPTQTELFEFTDWEEYAEPKVEGCHHTGDTITVEEYQRMHSGEKHTFKDLCDDYLEQQKGKVQINELPFTTTLEMHSGKAAEDQSEHAKEARKAVADEEHQKELLDTLVNAFAELVSQRVAQLLQGEVNTNHEEED